MHALGWEAKRLHWRATTAMARAMRDEACGRSDDPLACLTPARYDVMQVLWERPRWYRRRRNEEYMQSFAVVVEKLGLHISTVSKCVKRLVELGFVETSVRIVRRRRYQMLTMTDRGLDEFLRASEVVLGRYLPLHHLGADILRLLRVRERRARRGRPARPRCRRGLRTVDVVLRTLAVALRTCAEAIGSRAFSIYDPYFVDPLFPLHFGEPPDDSSDTT